MPLLRKPVSAIFAPFFTSLLVREKTPCPAAFFTSLLVREKNSIRRSFVSAISDMIFCCSVKIMTGCPSLNFRKRRRKFFIRWTFYWKKKPHLLSVLFCLPNLDDHVLTVPCSHTFFLLPLVSFASGCSNYGCYSMAQEVSRGSPAENEEVIWFFAHSCQSITGIKDF